ncbi:unnamed protein product [Gongylonema pulchrum]|uniref:MAM domain-containing protein n=1 Tax=Gongylonema pulchrum TaxID=637853 RepID=A0A3P6QH81_9BILA|nr:unnamed protein product [Gongylonema pulchrum]
MEVCLVDSSDKNFNCTAMLGSQSMPGKVLLPVPEVAKPFRIAIIPNIATGIIAIDDISYTTVPCQQSSSPTAGYSENIEVESLFSPMTTQEWIMTSTPTSGFSTFTLTESNSVVHTTELPFDLLILGNKTTPLFDRRSGRIITNTSLLLCDFTDDFSCQWGPESGRWGVIQEGAIPSFTLPDGYPAPTYPAAIVIQGTAMLTSDPLKCQTSQGKLMLRHWANGLSQAMQVCAIGYGIGSNKVECVTASQDRETAEDKTLLIFHFSRPILEPFTLNIIPQWDQSARNQYLIIDEIAYVGSCDANKLAEKLKEQSIVARASSNPQARPKTYENSVWTVDHQQEIASPINRPVTSAVSTHFPEWITLLATTTPGDFLVNNHGSRTDYCALLSCDFKGLFPLCYPLKAAKENAPRCGHPCLPISSFFAYPFRTFHKQTRKFFFMFENW